MIPLLPLGCTPSWPRDTFRLRGTRDCFLFGVFRLSRSRSHGARLLRAGNSLQPSLLNASQVKLGFCESDGPSYAKGCAQPRRSVLKLNANTRRPHLDWCCASSFAAIRGGAQERAAECIQCSAGSHPEMPHSQRKSSAEKLTAPRAAWQGWLGVAAQATLPFASGSAPHRSKYRTTSRQPRMQASRRGLPVIRWAALIGIHENDGR